jgi:hypothetical protein
MINKKTRELIAIIGLIIGFTTAIILIVMIFKYIFMP